MKTFAINEARKPSRIGSLAIVSSALLGAIGAAAPALSADLPDEMAPYRYYGDYSNYGYYRNCDRCDYNYGYYRNCDRCGWRSAPVAGWASYEEQIPVTERRWVQRDYIERRYPSYYATGYEYPDYGSGYGYSYYNPGYYSGVDAGPYPPYFGAAPRGEWPRVGFRGDPYPPRYSDASPRGERPRVGFRGDPYPPYADASPRGERPRVGFRGDPYPPPYADQPPRGERSRLGFGGDPSRPYSGPAPRGERSRRVGFGGDPYPPKSDPYLPKPAAYESEQGPNVPYRSVASSRPYDYRPGYEYDYYKPSTEYRPAYEYEPSPRPPVMVPGGYGHRYTGRGDSE